MLSASGVIGPCIQQPGLANRLVLSVCGPAQRTASSGRMSAGAAPSPLLLCWGCPSRHHPQGALIAKECPLRPPHPSVPAERPPHLELAMARIGMVMESMILAGFSIVCLAQCPISMRNAAAAVIE